MIDTGNYYPSRDGRIAAIEDGQPESAWVAEQIGRPVIKAFNNIYFKSLLENGRRKGTADRIALPVAGDPGEARAKVLRLVDELGFDPIDAGGLERSQWRGGQRHAVLHQGPHGRAAESRARVSRAQPRARIPEGGRRCG